MLTACQKDIPADSKTVRTATFTFWLYVGSPISPHVHGRRGSATFFQSFSLVIKRKVVQNVNRMSESQSDRKIYIAPGRQTE